MKEVGETTPLERAQLLEGAAFQEAAAVAGVPVPGVRRTTDGEVIAVLSTARVRVYDWVDLEAPDTWLEPAALGSLVAALHRVPFRGSVLLDDWYIAPLGAERWRETVSRLRDACAPFHEELALAVPEILALEGLLGRMPGPLRTCHRDLWADNLRRKMDGGLCAFDFDNAGLADPTQELACVLVEYRGEVDGRSRRIRDGYARAGGPGRISGAGDFAMAIAQLLHIVDEGCRRWLRATTDDDRSDNESWVREYLDRPLSRRLIESLLD